AIIGAGIFVLTGKVAAQNSGPAIVLSFILSGAACAFAGLCYAELASMIPVSGSAYTYAYATMGELLAWIIGWDLVLEYLFASSAVAVGWSGYVISLLHDFGITLPCELTQAPFVYAARAVAGCSASVSPAAAGVTGWVATGSWVNLPAVFVVFAVTILLIIGIRETASFNNVMVILKLAVIVAFISFGAFYINSDNWVPFVPENTGNFGEFGWSGVLRGAGVIFFAYIGFDAVSTAAQEAKNPQRDMPIGILGSLAICMALYILVSLVLTGIVSYKLLNVADPIAVGVNAMGPSLIWFRKIIKLAAVAGLSSVILVLLLGQPRIFFSMARDGLLPRAFAAVHPKFKTPYIASIVTGIAAMLIAGLVPIDIIGELVSIGTLLAFAIVSLGVWILRVKHPEYPRAFKTPWVPLVPILGAAFSILQMAALPVDTWLRLIIWMALGLGLYFAYGRRRSKLTHPS
ncbi:MAG: amino acid permease, partial [Spirochaetia bacterium]|nr:amino acid permease [Spirochaetia bacterium]